LNAAKRMHTTQEKIGQYVGIKYMVKISPTN
jgi:hypothetical protein